MGNRHLYRSGFTLIELMIVISLVSILFTASYLVYQNALMRARDAHRLDDVAGYVLGFEDYEAMFGTFFVTINSNNLTCDASSENQIGTPRNNANIQSDDYGCVGEWGNSYGLINATGNTCSNYPSTTNCIQDSNGGYINTTDSIGDALKLAGAIISTPSDPLAGKPDPDNSTLPYPDYYYAICQSNLASPALDTAEAVHFSVEARMEIPDAGQLANQERSCGGIAAGSGQ